ncbi:MAG TPA: response regulator [Cyanothece sp. UBA12306]|nr:response regulator [Cyanothece sp. UBA12306]
MTNALCKILLIEDKLDNVNLLQRLLSDAQDCSVAEGLTFPLTCTSHLEEGLAALEENAFDVILLNFSLPDSQGVNSLIKIREKWPNIPIIVETKREDETLIVQSFQLGADGYLQLQTLDSNLLVYEIRLSLERQQYRQNLAQKQQELQQAREFADLESLVDFGKTTKITARMFGADTLKESLPDIFQEFCRNYSNLLDLALEQRAFKVDHHLSDQLRILGDKLGFVKASPRDIIEIHTTILKDKNQDIPLAKAQAYISEGRMMVLELMGYLASFYRKYYIGLSNIHLSSHRNKLKDYE